MCKWPICWCLCKSFSCKEVILLLRLKFSELRSAAVDDDKVEVSMDGWCEKFEDVKRMGKLLLLL